MNQDCAECIVMPYTCVLVSHKMAYTYEWLIQVKYKQTCLCALAYIYPPLNPNLELTLV